MAVDINIPVVLPESADEYISQYGAGTAAVYLAYGTATTPTDGTGTAIITSGTERYDFWVQTPLASYFQVTIGDGTDVAYTGPVFQHPVSYCTLQEVVRGMDFPDTSRYDELEALCLEATDHITNYVCGGRSFFRNPVGSGETTLTLNVAVPHQSKLSLARGSHLDIISLSSVKVAGYTGDTYDTLTAGSTGFYLTPDIAGGQPYTDLVLSDQGTAYTTFPTGWATVQLTGVFGWATVPDLVRRATVDLVRFWWNARTADGEPVGVSAFGSPVFGAGMPKTVRDLMRSDYAWKDWVA